MYHRSPFFCVCVCTFAIELVPEQRRFGAHVSESDGTSKRKAWMDIAVFFRGRAEFYVLGREMRHGRAAGIVTLAQERPDDTFQWVYVHRERPDE